LGGEAEDFIREWRERLPSIDIFKILEDMKKATYLRDLELMILVVVLRLGDEAYGVPIARELKVRCRREVSLANVYATLDRLQESGYVSSQLADPTPERGGRAKRYFSVTGQGLKKVRETQRILFRLWQGVAGLQGDMA
jgi:PadR family transcriptional regulator, regulatory protein PadR